MISTEHDGELTAVSVFGELTVADLQQIEAEVARQLERAGRWSLLVDLRGMLGYTLDAALEDLRFTRRHAHDRARVAIIAERQWIVWTALLSALFTDFETRVFDDEAGAREWLAEG
jgi:hypothetical protein